MSQAWLSISRRSYHLRKPSFPIERAGSVTRARSRFSPPASIRPTLFLATGLNYSMIAVGGRMKTVRAAGAAR
jgi:hypothetical protein